MRNGLPALDGGESSGQIRMSTQLYSKRKVCNLIFLGYKLIIRGAVIYSKQQKEEALKLYKHFKSVSDTVRTLGYPTRKQLYNWIYEGKIHPNCVRN